MITTPLLANRTRVPPFWTLIRVLLQRIAGWSM